MASEIFMKKLTNMAEESSKIREDFYTIHNVKRGLRNEDHTGVLVGLTHVGDVVGYKKEGEKIIPIPGELYYSGIDVRDIVIGFQKDRRHGYDETVFLLLFGRLPNKEELKEFSEYLADERDLPENFTEDMILKLKGKNLMNMLARSVLALYTLDDNPDDTSSMNIVRQSISLIAKFPALTAYSYNGMRHKYQRMNLIVRHPKKELSTAENFLYMLKGKYTDLEANILDLALVLHAEHGGGNNSTFAAHVVSSSGTDTYSAIAAALGSLKGPLHGGANQKVVEMMEDIKANVKDWGDEKELTGYILKILNKEAFDKSGKIYGFGHPVYTVSDPRAILLKEKAKELAKEKDRLKEYELYALIEELVPKIFLEFKGTKKLISSNVDFYSGFVYDCIGIPKEVFTPIFAISRVSGWCAHIIEEVVSARRIIRPAYKNVLDKREYVDLDRRK